MAQAHLRSLSAVEDLAAALDRFAVDAREALTTAEIEIGRIWEWLTGRQRHWRHEQARCKAQVDHARQSLAACLASGYYDSRTGIYVRPSCSAQEEALARAQAHLRQAEEELATTEQQLRAVAQAIEVYKRQAQRLAGSLDSDLPRATTTLNRVIDIIQGYTGAGLLAAGVAMLGSAAAATRPQASAPSPAPTPLIDAAPPGAEVSASEPGTSGGALPTTTENTPLCASDPPGETIGAPAPSLPSFSDQSYKDAEGRALMLRIYPVRAGYYLRVFDQAQTPSPPDSPAFGNVGLANIQLEYDSAGRVRRVRLQDIKVACSYQGAGTGDCLLEQVYIIAKQLGAAEIYGDAPGDKKTCAWYIHRDYRLRQKDNRLQVYLWLHIDSSD